MKIAFSLILFASIVGCGGGEDSIQADPTPEEKASLDSKMDNDMKSMMGEMQQVPGVPKAE